MRLATLGVFKLHGIEIQTATNISRKSAASNSVGDLKLGKNSNYYDHTTPLILLTPFQRPFYITMTANVYFGLEDHLRELDPTDLPVQNIPTYLIHLPGWNFCQQQRKS